jgi:hypothetical protein
MGNRLITIAEAEADIKEIIDRVNNMPILEFKCVDGNCGQTFERIYSQPRDIAKCKCGSLGKRVVSQHAKMAHNWEHN